MFLPSKIKSIKQIKNSHTHIHTASQEWYLWFVAKIFVFKAKYST
jgi:hypothetical protein